MAFNPLPQTWFPGLIAGGTTKLATDLSVPIGTFPDLVASEIDVTTGDVRKFLYAICEKSWQAWNTLVVASRSNRMTLAKYSTVDPATGLITNTYTFTFINAIATQDVAPEV